MKNTKYGRSNDARNSYLCVAPDVKLGRDVKLSKFINLYGCEVGDETKIGAFVEVQKNAKIGKRCKVSSHTFVCEGVTHFTCRKPIAPLATSRETSPWQKRSHPRFSRCRCTHSSHARTKRMLSRG